MTCLACREHEHDCCGNILLPGSCGCGCVRILDPPMLRANVVVILGTPPHDLAACARAYHNRHRPPRRRLAYPVVR